VVMAAVPLQFIGVAAALVVAGKFLSMPAMLGIILLVGIVVNNSIILVEFVLGRLNEGMGLDEAFSDAVATRFRPVMMTALSTVAGMLPLALEMAVGSERFSPIATVIVGGILASTLLTLVIVPVLMKAVMSRRQSA
jgi:multidrug efflux pump subunit AcrB